MTKRRKKAKLTEELNEKETVKRWRAAIRSDPSIVGSIFKDGRVKVMTDRELKRKLEEKGVAADDVDNVIDEAERRKLITIDYETWSSYHWISPEKRKEEKQETQRLEKAVEDIFLKRCTDRLLEDELRKDLISTGLSAREVKRALYEAERDCVVTSSALGGCWEYRLVPPEERKRELEERRWSLWVLQEKIREKMEMGLEGVGV